MNRCECLLAFPHASDFQGLSFNSAETERINPNQSQVESQEPPWSFEREEMLPIGVEEVSNTSWALKSDDTNSSH